MAVEDSDQWVSMLAELLKNYPSNGTINFQLDTNSASFNDLVVEIKKLGKPLIERSECLHQLINCFVIKFENTGKRESFLSSVSI